ncbi:MAG: type II secretion system protein [Deltaproteobacteria bacterium]|nr:type II secretion system protein [Deltaproteobacteria bacterium]
MAHLMGDKRAFTLLEIVAALGIVMVIFLFVSQMTHFFQGQGDVTDTQDRVTEIAAKARAYYSSHGELPLSATGNGVPFGPAGLDINPKMRFDGWQRPLRYFTHLNDDTDGRPGEIQIDPLSSGAPIGAPVAMVVIPAASRTLMDAIEFNGRRVAGLIISSGPDQVFDYTQTVGYPDVFELNTGSDDMIVAIDLTVEATHIALAELKALNEIANAFEDRYVGVDNDGDNPPIYDEAGCRGIPYGFNPVPFGGVPVPFTDCDELTIPRTFTIFPPGTNIDISCGSPTLDYMKAHFCPEPWGTAGGCPPGYFIPDRPAVPYVDDPNDPGNACPGTDRSAQTVDYARIPFTRGAPAPTDCHWGLVQTLYGDAVAPEPNETDSHQARAFIFCLFSLSPEAIVDPWLNGYVWGCGATQTRDADGTVYGGCQYIYPIGDPHYHRFFSAGPNGRPYLLEQVQTPPDEPDDITY